MLPKDIRLIYIGESVKEKCLSSLERLKNIGVRIVAFGNKEMPTDESTILAITVRFNHQSIAPSVEN